jgi:hypothetical protein
VATLGFTSTETYLVQAPPYVIAYAVCLAVSWSAGRFGHQCWHIVACILVCAAGAILMISTLNVGARYFGLILLCSGPFLGLNVSHNFDTRRYSYLTCQTAPTFLGDHSRAPTSNQASGAGRLRQLCIVSLALVLSLLLPTLAGASVSTGRWNYHCWMRSYRHLLSACTVVGEEEEHGD